MLGVHFAQGVRYAKRTPSMRSEVDNGDDGGDGGCGNDGDGGCCGVRGNGGGDKRRRRALR